MNKRKPTFVLASVLMLVVALMVAAAPQDNRTANSGQEQYYPMMKGDTVMMRPGMMGQGMMGPGMMGQGMMGPGMMGRGMMGPGMMGRGMMGPGMMGCWGGTWNESPWADLNYNSRGELLKPLSKKKAEEIAQFYIERLGNPRLKRGRTVAKDAAFELEIVTQDNSLVDKLLIEKDTGMLYPARD